MGRLRGRISIVWLFTAVAVLPLAAAGAALLLLTARSTRQVSDALGRQLLVSASHAIQAEIDHYLDHAGHVGEALATEIVAGVIPPDADDPAWRSRLLAQLNAFPEVDAITFVEPRGRSVWLARYPGGFEYCEGAAVDAAGPGTGLAVQTFFADAAGNLDPASRRVAALDPRARPGYEAALAAPPGEPAWTPAYRWFAGEQRRPLAMSGVAQARRVRAPDDGRLLGVVSVDLSIDQIHDRLARAAGPLGATVIVTDDDDHVLGSSVAPTRPRRADLQLRLDDLTTQARVLAAPAPSTVPVGAAAHRDAHAVERTLARLLSTPGGRASLAGATPQHIGVAGDNYWAREVPLSAWPDARWRLALAVPEDALVGAARADARWATALGATLVAGTALISIALARATALPLSRLARFARDVGGGQFDRRLADGDGGASRDVHDLSRALNAMAASLEDRVSLLAQRDAAREATALKARVVAHVSHEFRTPLNAIVNYAELLRDGATQAGRPRDAADAANILTAGGHLLRLVNDLLDLSAADAGRLRLEPTDFDVGRLLAEVEATVRPLIERGQHNGDGSGGNRFDVAAPAEGLRIHSDPARVKQVLINLLSNAAKYTAGGLVELRADVLAEDDSIRFVVADTGVGMRPEAVARLFEPFANVEDRPRGRQGAGLGLAIVRQLSHALGGRVEIHSAPGRGTRATVTLPLRFPEKSRGSTDAPDDVDQGRPATSPAPPGSEGHPP